MKNKSCILALEKLHSYVFSTLELIGRKRTEWKTVTDSYKTVTDLYKPAKPNNWK